MNTEETRALYDKYEDKTRFGFNWEEFLEDKLTVADSCDQFPHCEKDEIREHIKTRVGEIRKIWDGENSRRPCIQMVMEYILGYFEGLARGK